MRTLTHTACGIILAVGTWLGVAATATQAHATIIGYCMVADDPSCNGGSTKVYASDAPAYKGPATIYDEELYCPTNLMVMEGSCYRRTYVPAWQWTQYGWRSANLANGASVYAWPFTGGWEWVWVSGRGWFAVRANRVLVPIGH